MGSAAATATRGVRLEKQWIVSQNFVTPGYLAALALPMRQGRDFTSADGAGAARGDRQRNAGGPRIRQVEPDRSPRLVRGARSVRHRDCRRRA